MTIVEIRDITKVFQKDRGFHSAFNALIRRGSFVKALDSVSMDVNEGEIFGLLGPNGAGKTTLLKIIAAMLYPTDGKALVGGYDVVRARKMVRELVSLLVYDERSHYMRLTGKQNLSFFATMFDLPRKQREHVIQSVLHMMGLEQQGDIPVMHYSSGMKQRLALARGLMGKARLILLDEPTKGLDPPTAVKIRRFIIEELVKVQGATVILATHNLAEAEEMCDRVALLVKGRIKLCGTIDQIIKASGANIRYHLKIETSDRSLIQRLSNICLIVEYRPFDRNDGFEVIVEFPKGRDGLSEFVDTIVKSNGKISDCAKLKVPLDVIFDLNGKCGNDSSLIN